LCSPLVPLLELLPVSAFEPFFDFLAFFPVVVVSLLPLLPLLPEVEPWLPPACAKTGSDNEAATVIIRNLLFIEPPSRLN